MRLWMTLLGFVAWTTPTWAQGAETPPPTLPAGTRARVHAPLIRIGGATGRLLGQRQDTVLFRPDHRSYVYRLPVASIRRLDLVARQRRNTLVGIAVGGLLGTGLGAGAGLGFGQGDRGHDAGTGAAVGAGVGVLLGAVFGTLDRTTEWAIYNQPVRVAAPLTGE